MTEDKEPKVDAGGSIKDVAGGNLLEGLLGGLNLDKLIDAAGKLGEASGNLSEDQIERLEEAKKVLGERGENVFNLGNLAGSISINSGSSRKPLKGKSDDTSSFKPFTKKGGVKKKSSVKKGPSVEGIKEPIVDVFPEEEGMTVVVEMPGVKDSDIHLELKDDILALDAKNYQKEIQLPNAGKDMTWTYKNGMLEVKIT